MLVLALLPQPSDRAQSTQKPFVYSVIRPDVLVAAKPAIKEIAQVPPVPAEAAGDSTTARAAETTPTRDKAFSKHSSSKRRTSGHRYAARKSHRHEVLGYARYGAYPRARYGFNSGRYGGWSFN
jgi:hypothetical protein